MAPASTAAAASALLHAVGVHVRLGAPRDFQQFAEALRPPERIGALEELEQRLAVSPERAARSATRLRQASSASSRTSLGAFSRAHSSLDLGLLERPGEDARSAPAR